MAPPVLATSGQITGLLCGVYGPAMLDAVAMPIQWWVLAVASWPE